MQDPPLLGGLSTILLIRSKHMAYSKQPRFKDTKDVYDIFSSWLYWQISDFENEPPYIPDSRIRDTWLRKFAQLDPHLAGVISTVVAIDKNRGWRMVGGRNQVLRYSDMLHAITVAPGVSGWRPAVSHLSQSFWTTDMGGLLECGREGMNGPLRALYSLDPARCKLTGKNDTPLVYYPRSGKSVALRDVDYIRVSSMPATDEAYNGLGYCAISRCLELTKIMLAIYQYDKEELGALAPRGLLLLSGISQKQWQEAMTARKADLEANEMKYFSKVAVLASQAANVEAKLTALSQLPTNFDMREWMDILMYGYALCFGYDPSEFYPVQFGAIGRGTETEIQHEKATGKGRLDCVLSFQEQLQEQFPQTLEFLFDQRDEKGDLLHAQVNKAWADEAKVLLDAGAITPVEARVLLADQNVIPRAWSEDPDFAESDLDEDIEGDELVDPSTVQPVDATKKNTRDILLTMPRVQRAIAAFPDEPLVEYSYPEHKLAILAERADDLLRRRTWETKKV